MEPAPFSPDKSPDRARQPASRQAARNSGGVSDRRAAAYTPKPDFADPPSDGEQNPPRNRRWLPWAAAAAAVVLLAGGGLALRHPHAATGDNGDTVLTLGSGDIDPAATADARAMLARGEIPPSLVHASEETRRAVADGRESLYSKQLLPPESPAGLKVRVTVSEAGATLAEDVLTSDHPRTTTFPAGPGMPAHFHFAVESTGPGSTVTCWASSVNGVSVHTPPMPRGGTGDLEAVAR